MTRGSAVGSRFELSRPTTTLGRDPRSDVFLDDISVSRHHAEIRRVGTSYALADAGSMNGTYLDGERVDEAVLEDLDEIQIGRFRLVFFGPRPGQPR
jgi:pSer/pThr/pTyr-binding forkhead associated (FHA) protein